MKAGLSLSFGIAVVVIGRGGHPKGGAKPNPKGWPFGLNGIDVEITISCPSARIVVGGSDLGPTGRTLQSTFIRLSFALLVPFQVKRHRRG